jgi:hypothetical protein
MIDPTLQGKQLLGCHRFNIGQKENGHIAQISWRLHLLPINHRIRDACCFDPRKNSLPCSSII